MIRIVTDTSSDITPAQAEKMNVDLVLQKVTFTRGEPYDQLGDEDFSEFYERLQTSKELPVTSQPAPGDYLEIFEQAQRAGDDVVVITISSLSSGTLQVAQIAREMAGGDNVYLIDSLQSAIGQRLLVEYAVQLRLEGHSAQEIYAILLEAAPRVRLFAGLDTLKYLRKGGRIPLGTEILGAMMGIKPIIEMRDGATRVAGKARGRAGTITTLVRLINENAGFDATTPVYFGYTRDAQPAMNFRKLVSTKFHLAKTVIYPVGGVIGTHVGPGGIAIAYLEKMNNGQSIPLYRRP